MKKIILSLVAIAALSLSSFGQAPEGFKYQAVVRDASNLILNNQAVGMRLIIQQGSIGGTAVYTETFAPTTNAFGLVNLEIGNGTSTDDFSTIDWANGPYFMETAFDVTGGTSYTVMGTSQLMSVPYALHAKTAENVANDAVDDADADPTNEIELPAGGLEGQILKIVGGQIEWVCPQRVGDTYEGGIIIQFDEMTCTGIVMAPPSAIQNQANSIIYCQNLVHNSYSDWYAPNQAEMEIIYNAGYSNGNGVLMPFVGIDPMEWYWSADLGVAYFFENPPTSPFPQIIPVSDSHMIIPIRSF